MRNFFMFIIVLYTAVVCVWPQSVNDKRLERFCFVLWHEDVDPNLPDSSLSRIFFNIGYPMVDIDWGNFDFLIASPVDWQLGTIKSRILARAPQGVDYVLYWEDGTLAFYLTILEVNENSGRALKIKLFNGNDVYYGFSRS